jgi:exodeoxyribonuclease V alpha subunit
LSKIVEFTGVVEVNPCNQPNFKIYGVRIDEKKYSNIKLNDYNNVTITGNIHDLGIGIEYHIKGEEINNPRFGWQYKVVNIKREKPTDNLSTRLFLNEILTPTQVESLMSVYPDIVDRVMKNKLDDIDLSKLYDIGEYRFNVIKKKIVENFALAELIDEFKGLIDFQTLKKLYKEYPSTLKIKQALRENPYRCLMSLARIGFKTADGKILELEKECKEMMLRGENPPLKFNGDLKTSKQREEAVILYLLEDNENNGNTKMNSSTLKNNAEKLAPACISHFKDVLENSEYIYFDKQNKMVAIMDTYNCEKFISIKLLEAIKNNIRWNFNIDKYKVIDGMELTNEQFSVLDRLCNNNVVVLTGSGGSGKSASTKAIIDMLKDHNKSFKLLSPTGKAAKVLKEYCKEETSTIHRALGLGLSYKEDIEKDNLMILEDLVLIDETSMCDVFLMKKVIERIDFSRTKLIFVGDDAQLPSVGAGNIFHDLLNSNIIPTVRLTKIFRYGTGGILTCATKTRKCQEFIKESKDVQIIGEDKGYVFIPTSQEKMVSNVINIYKKLLEKYNPEDIMVLTAYNKGEYGTVVLNNRLQPIANKNSLIDKTFIEVDNIKFYKNDIVMQTTNNYDAELYNPERTRNKKSPFADNNLMLEDCEENLTIFIPNGESGIIKQIIKENNQEYAIIKFDDGEVIYNKSQMLQLKLSYSIGIYKSQGSACKAVILLTPKAHTYMLNSNLIYVGQTRAKERVYHFGEIETINRAIKKKADFNRNTFLKEMLKEEH